MYQNVSEYDFRDAFLSSNTYKHNFSYEGLTLLYNWFEDYEDSCSEPFEFDMVAICCDFSEESWEDIADNYDIDLSDCDDDEERSETVQEYINDNGLLVGVLSDGETIIYQAF